MHSLFLFLGLALLCNTAAASTVYVKTPYEVSKQGQFMLFEQHEDSLILNEYPAFRSEKSLPLCK